MKRCLKMGELLLSKGRKERVDVVITWRRWLMISFSARRRGVAVAIFSAEVVEGWAFCRCGIGHLSTFCKNVERLSKAEAVQTLMRPTITPTQTLGN